MKKVDFEKAYNSISQMYLDYMLSRLDFCEKWRAWMRSCIFSGRVSVLVNDSPTEGFQLQKGLEQGDPLAPFLLLVAAECLVGLMRSATYVGLFTPFRVSDSMSFSILQFTDDTILVGLKLCYRALNLFLG